MISKHQFHKATSGSLDEIVSGKTEDNDKNTEIAHDYSLLLVVERIPLELYYVTIHNTRYYDFFKFIETHSINDRRLIWPITKQSL